MIGNRIKEIRTSLNLNQTDFGKRIGVKQSSVASYESGSRQPVDAVITSICREFSVNELWLRSGDGEPFVEKTRDQQIREYFADLEGLSEDLKQRLVDALIAIRPEDWKLIQQLVDRIKADSAAHPAPEQGLKDNKEMSREDFLREAARQWDEKHGKVTPGSGTSTPTRSGTA